MEIRVLQRIENYINVPIFPVSLYICTIKGNVLNEKGGGKKTVTFLVSRIFVFELMYRIKRANCDMQKGGKGKRFTS